MRTVKTIEKYDQNGKLVERITETTDSYEMSPCIPYMPSYSYPPFVGPPTDTTLTRSTQGEYIYC